MGTTLHPQQLLHTGSTVAMAIFEPGREKKKKSEGERERERGKREKEGVGNKIKKRKSIES